MRVPQSDTLLSIICLTLQQLLKDPKHVNYKVLCRKVQKLCDGTILKKAGISQLKEELNDLFDAEIGYMPAKAVRSHGCDIPEVAHWYRIPEYVCSLFLASSCRENTLLKFPIIGCVPAYLNLPLDELMLHIRKAVEKGHSVCWEGDISEPGFKEPRKNCVDIQPMERPVTQASRQKEFEQLRTTDDHVMEIIGIFMKGKQRFYVCRNSQNQKLRATRDSSTYRKTICALRPSPCS